MSDNNFDNYVNDTLEWREGKPPVNHNKTDYEAFEIRQKRDRERSAIRHKRQRRIAIEENLAKWENSISDRWKHADLDTADGEHRKRVLKEIDENGFNSFYFFGETGIGKTFHAYALIKEYIRRGYISPSQVVKASEGQMLDYVNTGYEGRNKLSKMLGENYRFYFFDDIGRGGFGTQDKRNAMWDRVIDHIYSSDAEFVMTSNFKLQALEDNFSEATFDRMFLTTNRRRIEFAGSNYRHKLAQEEITRNRKKKSGAEEEIESS